jgi:hypothetical protein
MDIVRTSYRFNDSILISVNGIIVDSKRLTEVLNLFVSITPQKVELTTDSLDAREAFITLFKVYGIECN